MAQQNINQYNFKKWYIKPIQSTFDISLASDEINYQEEVLFSNKIIASSDGNKLPIYFDLNSYYSNQKLPLNYGNFNSGNTLISINYYNPNNQNIDCFSSSTLCDIGLTGIDNGLVPNMTGNSISYTMGLLNLVDQFNRYKFDRRLKLSQVTGYTSPPNIRFSANTATTLYEIVSKTSNSIGYYNQLYGGFYQGFYKLFGYDYEVFPERTNKGWSVEMLLRPRQEGQYSPNEDQTTLNQLYPENKNTFFYFGTRAENKFYHHASGSPLSDSGYTRVTESLVDLKTCACSNTGVTNSRCIDVYEPVFYEPQHNTDCSCCSSSEVARPEKNPLFDSMSNALSFRLSGDPANPKVCVKVLKFTGDCSITGTCPNTGITYTTGYTVTEYCSSKTLYEYCEQSNPNYLNREHWFHLTAVWSRNEYFDICDLKYKGGLGVISKESYVDSLSNDTVLLIEPPITSGEKVAEKVEIVNLNEQWLIEKNHRLGSLKLYVNGQIFYVINGFEEIIPRGLDTEKEKQLGVPFNISWGGGTQGLRENLTFSGIGSTTYIQDPELFPNSTLSGSSLSALTTNILLENNFGGSFDGGITQFRMYSEPLNYPEIIHNFEILKNKFNLFDYRCPDCGDDLVNDITSSVSDIGIISFSSNTFSALTYTLYFIPEDEINRITVSDETVTPTFPTSYDITNSPIHPFLGAGDYYFYFNSFDQTLKVNNPTNYFGDVLLLGGDFYLVDGNGNYITI